MKKKYTLMLLFFCTITFLIAQISNEGKPKSWNIESVTDINPYVLPSIDLNKLHQEDLINDTKKETPYRVAQSIDVELNMINSGVIDYTEDGGRIWRVNIVSQDARTIHFIFDKYFVPKGATLYIYNDDRTDMIGAYDSKSNNLDKVLGTWYVDGDNVWVEYYEPAEVVGLGEIQIGQVLHGYRTTLNKPSNEKALNSSGACNLDVDCSIGSDFASLKEDLKHASAFVIMVGFVCSGSLINNTSNDGTPYFLLANHCNAGPPSAWSFRFNWISPNPICAQFTNSTDAAVNHTTSGATLLSNGSDSDYRLLLLNSVDSNWNLTWAGWDRTDTDPTYVVGIHHPAGDIMKVCRDDGGTIKSDANAQPVWQITSSGGGWEMGVTEGGSSGSPLFNESGRIIGQLWRGAAACSGTVDNGFHDEYGRFANSWTQGNFAQWLDPTDTGNTVLDLITQSSLSVKESISTNDFVIYPNPASENVYFTSIRNATQVDVNVFDITGKRIRSANNLNLTTEKSIPINTLSEGLYFVQFSDNFGVSTKKLIIKK